MSLQDEILALRKKRKQEEEEQKIEAPLFMNKTVGLFTNEAPVATKKTTSKTTTTTTTKAEEEEDEKWYEGWLSKGAAEDGASLKNIGKTILGSVVDAGENLAEGIIGMGEKVVDALATISPYVAKGQFYQNGGAYQSVETQKAFDKSIEASKEGISKFVAKDLYDEEKVAQTIVLGKADGSVFEHKSDSLLQSAGQLGATIGLSAAGVPWFLTTGVTSFGGEAENALQQGATLEEAAVSSMVSAGAEILTEKLSGGIKFGGKALDDVLVKRIASGISNKTVRTMAKLGLDAAGEGTEEIVSQVFSNLGSALYKEKSLEELLTSEEAIDEYIESFIGGAVLGGGMSTINAVSSGKQGIDAVTGLNQQEQAVVEKIYNDRVAEEEKTGKLTQKQKAKIYDEVLSDMDKGYISTDSIEEILGGETYHEYQRAVNSEESLKRQFDALNQMKQGEMTGEQIDLRNELKQQMEEMKSENKRSQVQTKLRDEVLGLVQNSRLAESYNELGRKSQAFEADLTQYDTKYHDTIKKAAESGIMNNTRRTHEFVDMIAKISADKGVLFDFTNNEKLKTSGFAVDGKTVNGYVTKDGVTLNIDSAKSLNSVTGHEITHVLEGTELYNELQKAVVEYAKSKGDYQGRYDSLSKLYANVKDANIDAELTADLVGDYLFTDTDFVNRLSVEHRNVFQKIYDEIKYLCKVATAGSKEARELEKVKRTFEKAYKEGGKAQTGTQYSISDSDGKQLSEGQQEYFKDSKMRDENGNLKVMYHGSQDAGFHVFDASMSDDGTSFFFVDRNDVAASYSGTTETYEARTIRTAEDMNNFLAEIGYDHYEAVEKNGKFELLENNEHVATKDTMQEIYEEFCWYEGVGDGDANYKVYLNLTNPLVVDAEGRNWNNVSREFSQEVADRYNTLTAEEKAALSDLAGWGDIGSFREEIHRAIDKINEEFMSDVPDTSIDDYTRRLADAYKKLNEPNMYDLFSIASENFSEEAIKQFAVKQMNTRDYAAKAKAEGYDGVIFQNIHDNGGYSNGSEGASTVAIAFNSEQIKSVANESPTGDKDIRFSLSEPVETAKNLVAVHNLSPEKLAKSLELGGLPMPSIAVLKAQDGHGEFGDISLVFGKDTVDPKAYRTNKIYSGDAWTPTYPSIEYKPNEKVLKAVKNKISALVPYEVQDALGHLMFDADNARDTLNRYGGNMAEAYTRDDAMKYAYLKDTGGDITLPAKEADLYYYGNISNAAVRYFSGKLVDGLQTVERYQNMGARALMQDEALKEAVADAMNWDMLRTLEPGTPEYSEYEQNPVFHAADVSFSEIDNMLVATRKLFTKGVQQTVDRKAAKELIRDAVDQEAYENWLKELFTGVVEKEGIRNNKDVFTSSGNRRSFEALHYEHNLENVIKAMREKGDKGLGGFGGGNIFGASTTEFSSIEEVKRADNRLQRLSEEEFEEIKKGFSDRLLEIASSLPNDKKSFIAMDDAANMLIEAVMKYSTRSGMANYLRRESQGWATYSDHVVDDLLELVNDIRSMPTGYFEAKPQRAVGFDEVEAVLVPDNLSEELSAELTRWGFNVVTYKAGDADDRAAKLNELDDLKFSLSEEGETATGKGVFGKDIALETAPVANTDFNTQPVSNTDSNTVNAEEGVMFPDDLAPVELELERLYDERAALENRVQEAIAAQSQEDFEAINNRWLEVNARIEELERDGTDRTASLTDEDAPPEVAPYDGMSDQTLLPKSAVSFIAQNVRSTLGLGNGQMADVHKLIEDYSTAAFPSREQLFNAVKEKFGTYTEKSENADVKELKKFLRSYGINVSETVRNGIDDYVTFRRRNFGKILFSKNGVPVDTAYQELGDMYPGLFPPDIINPADQLEHIAEVANMDSVAETERPIDDEILWGVTDDIIESVSDYQQNQREVSSAKFSREGFDSLMASADDYAPVAPVATRTTPKPETAVKAEDVAPIFDTASGQQAMFEGMQEEGKTTTRKELHASILDNVKSRFAEKGFDFDNVLRTAKNLSTVATVDNTPQRVMEKALGYKEGQILSDLTVNQVAQNETEGIKWLNSFTDRKNGLLAQLSKQYHIKPGSKESAAAQMYAEGFYVDENNNIIEYGNVELAKDFPDARVQANIKGLAGDPRIRQIYDDTLTMINESRTRNAYPEIQRLDNYFLHFRAMDDTFSRLGLPFNPNDIRAKDLPTDLNGVTADLKPGQPYFASAMHRTGKRTSFDLLGGLEKYLTSAKNQIYHIDDIQTLRALRNYIADTYGQANGLDGLDALSEEEAQERIEQVYNSHLSTFTKFLNEEANMLAGKTALIDRGLEGIIGRRGITFLNSLNRQVGANMVGYNISSSMTNFLPVAQTFAKTQKRDFTKAFAQTVANRIGSIFGRNDGFNEASPVAIRRKGADRFYSTPWQKISDPGYALMGAVDSISTELIARTKYNEFTRKGMDSQTAHFETDKWVSRLMGDRSLGQMPQLYNSKMLGLVTKFQLEVRNQLDSQFYDTIKETQASNEQIESALARNAKTAAKVASTFVQLAVVQHLYGKAFESVAGYNPAFDIIEVLLTACGFDDDEDSEDTVLDNIEQGFLALLEDLPYTSVVTDGGRIPISSAMPLGELIKGEDEWGNEKSRWETLGEIAPYYVLPGGYGQIKKTTQGLSMFSDEHPIAGSYTDSGNLRFPVEDTLKNRVQAGIFGQWASENARDYFDNERSPLKEKQIQEFIDVDIPIRDYWEYREGLSGLDNLSEKADYINSLDLPIDKKNLLINNIADREEDIDMSGYDDYGSFEEFDFAVKNPEKYEIAQKVGGYEAYMEYQEGMKDMKLAEKVDYVAGLDLTTEQKNALINGETDRKEPIDLTGYENYSSLEELDFARKNPESYAVAKAVGGYDAYVGYSDELNDIKADKDEWGQSISGSRKEKVREYINNLDADYYTKIILWKSEYNSDDTNNYEIIDYLNGREDISYEEMEAILLKLGFKVDSNGNISW